MQPGDDIEFAYAPTRMAPGPKIDHFVLLGDSAALPAMNSLIEYLPENTKITVLLVDTHHLPLNKENNRLPRIFTTSEEQVRALQDLDLDLTDTYHWTVGREKPSPQRVIAPDGSGC